MTLKTLLTAGVAAAALACMAVPAEAALMTATFKGMVTIDHGSDMTFGVAGLVGQTYTAVYSFDPTRGTQSLYAPGPGSFDEIRAGYVDASPIRSLSITVNGVTDVITFEQPAYSYGAIEHINNPFAPRGSVSMRGQSGKTVPSPTGGEAYDYFQGGSNFGAPTQIPFDWTVPWTPAAGPNAYGTSGFLRQVQNAGRGYDQAYNFGGSVTSVRIQSGAPEPASWALMIGGFGLAGAALRRRKAVAA